MHVKLCKRSNIEIVRKAVVRKVSLVFCTDSFVDSTQASLFDLGLSQPCVGLWPLKESWFVLWVLLLCSVVT